MAKETRGQRSSKKVSVYETQLKNSLLQYSNAIENFQNLRSDGKE